MGERERMDKASWKRGELPPLPLHTLCHPRLLHASLPPSCLALAFYSSSPPFFFFFSCPKGYYIFSCVLSLSPLAIHTILPHSSPLPSLLFFFFPPPLLSLHLSACITFSPGYVEWTESRTMAAFQSHDPVLEVGGGGHWLLVFFFSLLSIQNRLMQLAYYWHVSPQN